MNEILPSSPPEEENTPKAPGRGLAFLALLIALAAAGGAGWLLWQDYSASGEQAEKMAAATAKLDQQLSQLDNRVSSLDTRVSGLASANPDSRLKSIEQELEALDDASKSGKAFQAETSAWTHSMQAAIEGDQARIAGIEARLAALSAKEMSGSTELDLAEIDYVLRLAQERLQLFGDTRTAEQALAIADQHIAAFDNPLYLGLRREIASAQQALQQVVSIDYSSVYRSLDTLQSGIADLSFRGAESTEDSVAADDDTGWWARIKSALSGLVTVQRQSEEESQIPVIADQVMIRQHAWLELEVARLAAMRRDQSAWANSLSEFSDTLKAWFAPETPALRSLEVILSELQSVNVDPALPDISAPWLALQAIRASGVSAPPPVSAPAGEPSATSAAEAEKPQGDAEPQSESATAEDGQ